MATAKSIDESSSNKRAAYDTKGHQEGKVLVVYIFLGVGYGGMVCLELCMTDVDNIARAYAKQRMLQEYPPGVAPQLETLEHGEIGHATTIAIVLIFEKHHIVHLLY